MKIDDELLRIARTKLLDSFYEDFSDLVNKYIEAGKGLPYIISGLSNASNFPSVNKNAVGDAFINIYTVNWRGGTTGHTNLLEALECEQAKEVWLNGVLVATNENPSCSSCNGTGDITSIDGEWHGYCPFCLENEDEKR